MEAWARRRWLVVAAAAGAAVTALLVPALAGDGEVVRTAPEPTGSQVPPTTPASTTASTTTQPPTSRQPTPTTGPTTRPPTSATPSTRPPAAPAVVVRRGRSTEPVVALTFDAGSDVGWTVLILDTLAANGIRATFGITGTWADAHPDLVAQIVAAGHQVVNHSDDHSSFTGRSTGTPELTRAERIDQLARADAAILAAAGVSTVPWFRPPYGDEDESVRVDAGLAGYRYELLWTVDSLGWQGLAAGDVVRRCLDRVEPGAIYLFHVGSASTDHDALQPIIDGLRARGYGFATAAAIV